MDHNEQQQQLPDEVPPPGLEVIAEDISTKVPQNSPNSPSEKKAHVKWADIAKTPSSSSAGSAESSGSKVKTPYYYKKKVEHPKFSQDSSGSIPTVTKPKAKYERRIPESKPRETPMTGHKWIGFCGNPDCTCVYTFRDGLNCISETTGRPVSCHVETLPGDSSPVKQNTESDKPLDIVRLDSGKIYDNQLYIRGWTSEAVSWEAARERLNAELAEIKESVLQIFVDPKGFAFLSFSDHAAATKAQSILFNIQSFFGERLLINFATVRK